jgi:hypothetical protein
MVGLLPKQIAPRPFRCGSRVITPGSSPTGHDCLAVHGAAQCRNRHVPRSRLGLRQEHRPAARLASTWAPLPLYGVSRTHVANCQPRAVTFTWPTQARHRIAAPAAAEVPTLVRVLRLLGHVARRCYPPVRCGMPRLPARTSFAAEQSSADFPRRMQKLGVPAHSGGSRFGTVSQETHWQALPYLFGWAFRG